MAPSTRRLFGVIAICYLASAFVHLLENRSEEFGSPRVIIGPVVFAPPRVLSGDSPHYLIMVQSLLNDGDLDLSNNYRAAAAGAADLGVRFQGRSVDRHTDLDRSGRERGTHSPFFAMLVALLLVPLAGTAWVESGAVLLTTLISLTGIRLFGKLAESDPERNPLEHWLLVLAMGTSLWCYSRDLWSEPWVLTLWVIILLLRRERLAMVVAALAILIKYPFALYSIGRGIVHLWRRQYRLAVEWLGSAAAALGIVILVIQWQFRDVPHFSLFHSGRHSSFDWPVDGLVGLLFDPVSGLLLFFPVFLWCFGPMLRGGIVYFPAFAFFLLHCFYSEWFGGTGFSSRYLVPMFPVLLLAVREIRPSGWWYRVALIYGGLWGVVGGLFPGLVYDRSPWQVIVFVAGRLFGGW